MMGGRKKLHTSWRIGLISLGLLIGIALSSQLDINLFSGAEWLVVGTSIGFASFARRSAGIVFIALTAGLIVGLWRGSSELRAVHQYQSFYGQQVVVIGAVEQDTTYGAHGDQQMRLSRITINDEHLRGSVWVSVSQKHDVKRGDIVEVTGTLSKGFGTTPATIYQAKIQKIERPSPGDIGRRARDWFGQGVSAAIPEPQASLANGFLLGQKSTLPEGLNNELKIVGLTHAVVASGYNLTILVSLARRLLAKTSKYLAALSATTMVISFVLVTGYSPSMTRAGIIALLSLAAWYYGRIIHPVILLLFVGALTAMIQPAYVWGDIGWYLSFSAFAGVILFAPLLHRYFWGKAKKVPLLRQTAVDTMSAQILTAPIIMLSFGTYSTYALLANVLILPLVPLVMLTSAVAGLMSIIMPLGDRVYGFMPNIILEYMITAISKISELPHAQGEVEFTPVMLVASYIIIATTGLYMWRKTKYNFAQSNPESELYSG